MVYRMLIEQTDEYLEESMKRTYSLAKRLEEKEVNQKMYEVTYTQDGILKKFSIRADDQIQAQQIFTNMFSGQRIEIIDIRRI